MTAATRYFCPLDCGWHHDQAAPDFTDPDRLYPIADIPAPADIDQIAFQAAAGALQAVNAIVKAHLETHGLLDWVQAITRIKAERDRLTTELRQHATCRTCGHERHEHTNDTALRANYCSRCTIDRDVHDFQAEE